MSTQPSSTEQRRRRAADIALASVALDGVEPDQPTRDLLDAAVRRELSTQQVYDHVLHGRINDG
jgi:antitoxin VbhA-like protein